MNTVFPYSVGRAYEYLETGQIVFYIGPRPNAWGQMLPWFQAEEGVQISHVRYRELFRPIGSEPEGTPEQDNVIRLKPRFRVMPRLSQPMSCHI